MQPKRMQLPQDAEEDPWSATRKTLLIRLKNWDDHESWREFFDKYGRLIFSVARKSGLSEDGAQEVLQVALERVKRRVKPEHYAIFHLHGIREQPAKEVARALKVSIVQVHVVKHRVSSLVRKELARLQELKFA